MSCMGCMESYGFWRKEKDCPSCDRIFCSKCVSRKAVVKGKKEYVCGACFHRLTNTPLPDVIKVEAAQGPRLGEYRESTDLPPASMGNSLAAQSSRTEIPPPRLVAPAQTPPTDVSELENRLNALKSYAKERPAPQEEIEGRLAGLRGVPVEEVQRPGGRLPPPSAPKTAAEESGALLDAMGAEAALEARLGPPPGTNEHLQERLRRLRGHSTDQPPPPEPTLPEASGGSESEAGEKSDAEVAALLASAGREAEAEAEAAMEDLAKDGEISAQLARLKADSKAAADGEARLSKALSGDWAAHGADRDLTDDEDDPDDEATRRTVQRAIAEAELEERLAGEGSTSAEPRSADRKAASPQEAEEEEMPWCSICTDDAVLRCRGCDGDLFCRRCFREQHSKADLAADHKWAAYKLPRKPKKETDV